MPMCSSRVLLGLELSARAQSHDQISRADVFESSPVGGCRYKRYVQYISTDEQRCLYLRTPPDLFSIIALAQLFDMMVIISVFTVISCSTAISLYNCLWIEYWCIFLSVIGVVFIILGAFFWRDFGENVGVVVFGLITLVGVEVWFCDVTVVGSGDVVLVGFTLRIDSVGWIEVLKMLARSWSAFIFISDTGVRCCWRWIFQSFG